MFKMIRFAVAMLLGSAFGNALAAEYGDQAVSQTPLASALVAQESGFSGFVMLGAAVNRTESNMISGNNFGNAGEETISSIFDSPDAQTTLFPVFNFDLRYTFAESRTEIFAGNRLEDLVRFDLTTQLGVRREFSKAGTLGLGLVFSSVPAEVWQDPYVENIPRQATDRNSRGVRFNWQQILGSRFRFQYTYRDIDIDRELSGLAQLDLPLSAAKSLDRNGDRHEVELLYPFQLTERQTLIGDLVYQREDLDGDAMSYDGYYLQLTHSYRADRFLLVTNASIGQARYDERNPIYLKTREDDRIAASVTLFWPKLLGAEKWTGVAGLSYIADDSNIDFYDSSVTQGFLAAMYSF